MLVLSRRQGESIVIGGDVVVTIIEVRGGQVRVGIDAPRSIEVHREEVFRAVARENLEAVRSAGKDPGVLRQALPSKKDEGGGGEGSVDP